MNDIKYTPAPIEFREFPKIGRLMREMVVSEKIDGTNAQVYIFDDGQMLFGSRTRWITPEDDNFGFARWATEHREELLTLGVGRHYGEWWGQGIQRNYGLKEKRLSLFNVSRWCLHGEQPQQIPTADPRMVKFQEVLPACVGLVPVLYRGDFSTEAISTQIERLKALGSVAAPGFNRPEGVVVFHTSAGVLFKKTLDNDDKHKGSQ